MLQFIKETNTTETSWRVSLPPRSDPRMPRHIRDLLLDQQLCRHLLTLDIVVKFLYVHAVLGPNMFQTQLIYGQLSFSISLDISVFLCCLEFNIRDFRKADDNVNENVTQKSIFTLSALLCDYSNFHNQGEFSWNMISNNGVEVQKEKEKFAILCPGSV